jgi:light-regulated signal transduction histidine kinase (bacteriophytochrome)
MQGALPAWTSLHYSEKRHANIPIFSPNSPFGQIQLTLSPPQPLDNVETPGIAEGDLARVFEPSFTTKREGLGMGLSISQSIVQANGGRVWVENSARHGAIFHCMLPVAQQGEAAATL